MGGRKDEWWRVGVFLVKWLVEWLELRMDGWIDERMDE